MTLCTKSNPFWITCWHLPTSFSPNENLTIDESVFGYRGRVTFRVYLKNQSDKYGIKLSTVRDSKTRYVLRTEVYTSKGQQDNSIIGLFQRLLFGYLGKGHTIFMDRFYSTLDVFGLVWARKTKAVGTCIPN
jgi:hypothetical protein